MSQLKRSPKNKVLILFCTILVILILLPTIYMSNLQKYEIYLNDLTIEEAGQIAQIFKDNNISYRHDPELGVLSLEKNGIKKIREEKLLEDFSHKLVD